MSVTCQPLMTIVTTSIVTAIYFIYCSNRTALYYVRSVVNSVLRVLTKYMWSNTVHSVLPYFLGYKTDFFPSKTIPKI